MSILGVAGGESDSGGACVVGCLCVPNVRVLRGSERERPYLPRTHRVGKADRGIGSCGWVCGGVWRSICSM